jgi:hypothetical protein
MHIFRISLYDLSPLSAMNSTFLAGWEEEGAGERTPLLYTVMDIWANLCIFSE